MHMPHTRAFSLIEILVVFAVIVLLATGALYSMTTARANKQLGTIVDGVVFTLEEAKSNALSGKGGTGHGVHFASDEYVLFEGNSYDSGDPDNQSFSVESDFTVTWTLTGGGSDVVFARLTGEVAASGTVTITDDSDPSRTTTVQIGSLGDVSVVE